jgi:hypothetical protein
MTAPTRAAGSRIRGLLLILAPLALFATASRDQHHSAPDEGAVARFNPTLTSAFTAVPVGACSREVSHPLSVRLEPLSPPTPGAALTARVEVTAHRLVDDVEILVRPPAGVSVLAGQSARLGLLRADTPASVTFTIQLPPDETRRTVDVLVRGHVDGSPVMRGATLNLNFREEPSRLVIRPDGRRVREVPARRIG